MNRGLTTAIHEISGLEQKQAKWSQIVLPWRKKNNPQQQYEGPVILLEIKCHLVSSTNRGCTPIHVWVADGCFSSCPQVTTDHLSLSSSDNLYSA